jgi:hypothetical protein
MRTETVEIYSDETNNAVLRHPGRKFPGVLIQGDTLYAMCKLADRICDNAQGVLDPESYAELAKFRNGLRQRLTSYKVVLGEHGVPLPFNEEP